MRFSLFTYIQSLQIYSQSQDGVQCSQGEGQVGKPEVMAHGYLGYFASGEDGDGGCRHEGEVAHYPQIPDKGEIQERNICQVLKESHVHSFLRIQEKKGSKWKK